MPQHKRQKTTGQHPNQSAGATVHRGTGRHRDDGWATVELRVKEDHGEASDGYAPVHDGT
jgi:hypothetical protein